MRQQLSALLAGHTQDVRAVCSPSPATVISTSRDATARVWKRKEGSEHDTRSWNQAAVLQGHNGFVGAVTYSKLADGTQVAITGGNDSVINSWDLQAATSSTINPLRTLIGHSSNVCCLNATEDGLLASGSWDA